MKIVLALVILLLSVSVSLAEMSQWTAEDGKVTLKDIPPPASGKRAANELSQPVPAKKVRFSGTVEIYITDWCGYCKQAQRYMKSKGIPYVAYDIEKDQTARQRHKELGGNGVPLIIIGSNRMSGFSAQALEYYLDNSR